MTKPEVGEVEVLPLDPDSAPVASWVLLLSSVDELPWW